MPTTPKGNADASVVAEAGRLVAGAVVDATADALLKVMGRDPVNPRAEPEPPVPSQTRERPEGGHHRAPVADQAVARVETAVAAATSAVLSRLDINAILDRVDVQRVVDRVDVDAVVQRVDLNDALAEVDVDALIDRVDIDAIVDRIDVGALADEALDAVDVGEVIRESTSSLGSDAVEGFRQQAMVADTMIATAVDRMLRRSGPRVTALETAKDRS